MGLNIKNTRLESDIRELAKLEGLGLTEAVQKAVQELLERARRRQQADFERRMAAVRRIQERVKAKRGGDMRTSTEQLDELYGDDGLPI